MAASEQEKRQWDSELARARLNSLLQTKAVLKLILEEAGLTLAYTPAGVAVIKTCNVKENLGVTPQLALVRVIASHLRP